MRGVGQITKKIGAQILQQMNSGEKTNRAELLKPITKKYLFHVIRPKRSQSEDHLPWEKKVVLAHICEKKYPANIWLKKKKSRRKKTAPLPPPKYLMVRNQYHRFPLRGLGTKSDF